VKLLLLGAQGQVGWELQRALAPLGEVVACARAQADLSNLEALRTFVRNIRADVIVNAAAYTAVDKAESESELAMRVNAEAVGVLAEEASRTGTLLVHYSTDYVFDGLKQGAYGEDDIAVPVSIYGHSKLQGEHAVRTSGARHFIFRTSWVYAPRGRNFPRTILNLARTRPELKVVADQIGAPTSAELIADVTALALYRYQSGSGLSGTYHLTASGETSWHGFARRLVGLAHKCGYRLQTAADQVHAITTAEFPTPARRIANSRLDTHKLRSALGIHLPVWDAHLDRFLEELPHESFQA
jgi:dTDP-4-dehydrorhamnose reductase